MSYFRASKYAAEAEARRLTVESKCGLEYEARQVPDGRMCHGKCEYWPWGVASYGRYADRPELGRIFKGYVYEGPYRYGR